MFNLPSPLDNIFANTNDLSKFFDRLMYGMVELLNCDRCYLYIRDPQSQIYKIPHCYRVHPEIPDLTQTQEDTESFYCSETDPLFAAALSCEPTIYIENVEQLIHDSKECFIWQRNYSEYKALMQAHISMSGELWGIIQAAHFNHPRPWTQFDRNLVLQIIDKITPLVTVYVKRTLRGTVQCFNDNSQ